MNKPKKRIYGRENGNKPRCRFAALLLICLLAIGIDACGRNTPSDDISVSSQTETESTDILTESREMIETDEMSEESSGDQKLTEESETRPAEMGEAAESAVETEVAQVSGTVPTVPVETTIDLSGIPVLTGGPYVVVNDNVPAFTDAEMSTISFETYSELDYLGRCGVAYANIGTDLMPKEERGSIGQVRPTGWHTVKYDCVDGKYLYNRCHLIGYQLTAENANTKNLITGTRYMNVEGMLPFENMVADYVKETGNHVLYRVTPVFEDDNLVAYGVLMEAKSVEDNGEGILFNVFCNNGQPGVAIDYSTGDSFLDGTLSLGNPDTELQTDAETEKSSTPAESETTYILNTNTHKFHYPSCSSVSQMNDENKQEFVGTRDEVIGMGYDPCGRCHP